MCGLDRAATLPAGRRLLRGRSDAQLLLHCLDQLDLGLVSRTIESGTGAIDAEVIDLAHGCVSCTLREDVLPTLRQMAADQSIDHVVVVLPEAVEPIGFLESFLFLADADGATTADVCRIQSVVALVDSTGLVPSLSNHETLADRGLSIGDTDDRGVGDVLVRMVECADVVVAPAASPQERALLRMLNLDAEIVGAAPALVAPAFDFARTSARTSPAIVDHFGFDCHQDDAWTLHWRTNRPLHPIRLHDALDDIAEIALRGRGHFRIATRPAAVVEWDSVGSRLRLGAPADDVDPMFGQLSFVGVSERHPVILRALDAAVLTDAELAAPAAMWSSIDDPFLDIWLAELDLPDFADPQED